MHTNIGRLNHLTIGLRGARGQMVGQYKSCVFVPVIVSFVSIYTMFTDGIRAGITPAHTHAHTTDEHDGQECLILKQDIRDILCI